MEESYCVALRWASVWSRRCLTGKHVGRRERCAGVLLAAHGWLVGERAVPVVTVTRWWGFGGSELRWRKG